MKPILLDPLGGPSLEWTLAESEAFDKVDFKFLYFVWNVAYFNKMVEIVLLLFTY